MGKGLVSLKSTSPVQVPTTADPPPCAWPRDAQAIGNAAVAATSNRLVIRMLQLSSPCWWSFCTSLCRREPDDVVKTRPFSGSHGPWVQPMRRQVFEMDQAPGAAV